MDKKRVPRKRKVPDSTKESVTVEPKETVEFSPDAKILIDVVKESERETIEQLLTEAPIWPSHTPSAAQLEKFKEDYKLWLTKLKTAA